MNPFRWFVFAIILTLTPVSGRTEPKVDSPTRRALSEGSLDLLHKWKNVHPRLFFSSDDLEAAAADYHNNPAAFGNLIPASTDESIQPPLPAQGDAAAAMRVLRVSMAYAVTQDRMYRDCLVGWTPVLAGWKPLASPKLGGFEELFAGEILLDLALSYDALKGRCDPGLEAAMQHVIVAQAELTYHDLLALDTYPYEQNHLTIPCSGLAVAGLVLLDEEAEAKNWGRFGANVLRRGLEVLAPDGWFFEGPNYFSYTLHYMVSAANALRRTTGEDLFGTPFLTNLPLYLSHITLPDRDFVFDFCDWGPKAKEGGGGQKGIDAPWHTVKTHLDPIVPLQLEWSQPSPVLEAFLAWTAPPAPNMLKHILYPYRRYVRPEVPPAPGIAPYHYFDDMEVVHWRSSWIDPQATAIAFKSGPPAGHLQAKLLSQYPEWHAELGHAHPDAGTFTLFAHGVFLANGDAGYGRKDTANCNSILVDGIGQQTGGTAWHTFRDRPYQDHDPIRLENVWLAPSVSAATAVFDAAYMPVLQMKSVRRGLILIDGRFLVVRDEIVSGLPHRFEWRLHGDKAATAAGADRFIMENGAGRLVMQSLLSTDSYKVEPTVLDADIHMMKSQPYQHGFHLSLFSPADQKEFSFLVACGVQASTDGPDAFTAKQESDGHLEMTDAAGSCGVWLKGSAGLDGTFAYVLRQPDGAVVATGLEGHAFHTKEISLRSNDRGLGTARRGSDGRWRPEADGEELEIIP